MNYPIIELKELSKNYGSLKAVNNLNLTINKGEIFGLLGPNGAGKTTSILMMLGLTEPSHGTAIVCSENATRNPIRVKRKVGYLPDNVGFYNHMTAIENLIFIARLNDIPYNEAANRALEVLKRVGLTHASHKKTGTFSRGMKQRLGLAEVLIKKPEILILDEPTLGIDPSGVNEFLNLLKQLSREEGLTVLLSSHHLHQVQRICDRIGIFVGGRLLVEGSIQELTSELLGNNGHTTSIKLHEAHPAPQQLKNTIEALPSVARVNIHELHIEISATENITPQIVRKLVEEGAAIGSVNQKTYNLDDIYEKYFENTPSHSLNDSKNKISKKRINERSN